MFSVVRGGKLARCRRFSCWSDFLCSSFRFVFPGIVFWWSWCVLWTPPRRSGRHSRRQIRAAQPIHTHLATTYTFTLPLIHILRTVHIPRDERIEAVDRDAGNALSVVTLICCRYGCCGAQRSTQADVGIRAARARLALLRRRRGPARRVMGASSSVRPTKTSLPRATCCPWVGRRPCRWTMHQQRPGGSSRGVVDSDRRRGDRRNVRRVHACADDSPRTQAACWVSTGVEINTERARRSAHAHRSRP